MTTTAMIVNAPAAAQANRAAKASNAKLGILIAVYGSLSIAFYGAVGWGAYRAVEWLVG